VLNLFTALQTLALGLTDRITSDEKGASAVEYALMVGLIALAVVAGVTAFGADLLAEFQNLIP
jgi:pilus assembly protein Flp/PilA